MYAIEKQECVKCGEKEMEVVTDGLITVFRRCNECNYQITMDELHAIENKTGRIVAVSAV